MKTTFLILILLLLPCLALALLPNKYGINISDLEFKVLASALLYVLSHLIRSVRLRLAISSAEFSTSNAVLVQFQSSAIGNLLPPFFKDIIATLIFKLIKELKLVKILISLIYLRFFDFIVLTPILLFFVAKGNDEYSFIAIMFLSIIALIFFFFISISKIIDLLVNFLISFSHTKRSLILIKFLRDFQNLFDEMNFSQLRKIVTIFFLTLFAWFVEIAALVAVLFTQSGTFDIFSSYYLVLTNAFTNLPFLQNVQNISGLYIYAYFDLIVFSLLIVIKFIMDLKKNKLKRTH